MKFKINNREWTITEVSQQAIKNMQNIRKANEDENLKYLRDIKKERFCSGAKVFLSSRFRSKTRPFYASR